MSGTKSLDRIDWVLFNAPRFSADDLQCILATCAAPLPESDVSVIIATYSDGYTRQSEVGMCRKDALEHYLKNALVEFLLQRLLEAESADNEIYKRFRQIQDAAERLQRTLGLQNDGAGLQIAWPIAKRLLQVSLRSPQQRGAAAPHHMPLDNISARLAEVLRVKESLRDALSGILEINMWTVAAASLERAQQSRQRSRRDSALDHLVWALESVWTDVLGQTLSYANNSSRNISRWAATPESFERFVSFCQLCVRPISIELVQEEVRASINEKYKARKRQAKVNTGKKPVVTGARVT